MLPLNAGTIGAVVQLLTAKTTTSRPTDVYSKFKRHGDDDDEATTHHPGGKEGI